MKELLDFANVLVIPAFFYIIVLERRITKLQTQIAFLIRYFRVPDDDDDDQ